MNLKFGIREKLLLPLLGSGVLIIIIISSIWLPSQLERSRQEFISDQISIIKTLSPSIIQNILTNNLAELHNVLENSLSINSDSWKYLKVINSDGEMIYPVFQDSQENLDELILIKIPIEENDELFGHVSLHVDWSLDRKQELDNINKIAAYSVVLILIVSILSYLLQTRWLYKPILRLKEVTNKFSDGDYNVDLPAAANDEIGALTKSIDSMRKTISNTQRDLKNKEKLQRAILDSVLDAIITINEKGIILSFNPGAETIFQYKADEIIGNNINVLMTKDDSDEHDKYLSNFNPNPHQNKIGRNRELLGKRKDQSEFPIELTINAKSIDINDKKKATNSNIVITGVIRDITERKKEEQAKNNFVSMVSHELRTPLTAIKGALDMLTLGIDIKMSEQASSMLDIAGRNANRLIILINDILDMSKFESGEFELVPEQIQLNELIDNSITLNQEYAIRHNTKYICTFCNENIVLNIDKNRLYQVMSNLLSNAAKYSPERVPVEIFTNIIDGNIRINVKDYGPGIPEEFREVIFDEFTQSSSGITRKVGGTGLGLNISRKIIQAMGGTIGFKSIINQETTFYFELPIYSESSAPALSAKAQ